jgi:hypothetical protein
MAGERTEGMIVIASRVAARIARAAARTEDAWAGPSAEKFGPAELAAKLDRAGHIRGGGFDGCEVCTELVAALPQVLAGAFQQQQEGAQG